MGKAKILSDLGDGQYKIQVLESRERAESAKGQAESRITENRTAITHLESDIQAAQAEVERLAGEQSDAIHRFQSGESGLEISDLSKYAEAIAKAAESRDKIRIRKKTKERMIEADQSLIGKVNALPPLREMQAWCADYTDDLSGEVATAEVPGEIGQVIIKPGFEGANQWSPQADGMIQPALSSTPAGTFYNLAMLPGCQKWRPTFRTATLTSVDTDNDTGSISLDSATSSQQGLGVNDQTSFSDVPIEYMDCNSGAFESGDKVLVAFAGGAKSPTIIGFEAEPKECDVYLTYRSFIQTTYRFSGITSDYGGYPPLPPESHSSQIYRVKAKVNPGEITYQFYGYSKKQLVDELASITDRDSARSYMAEFKKDEEDKGKINFVSRPVNREVGRVYPPTSSFSYNDRNEKGEIVTKTSNITSIGASKGGPINKKYNMHYEQISVSAEEISYVQKDSPSSSRGMYSVGAGSQLGLSRSLDETKDAYSLDVSLSFADFPPYLKKRGKRYVPNRFLQFTNKPPQNNKDVYLEYIMEDRFDDQP